jgi:hypothetical protein
MNGIGLHRNSVLYFAALLLFAIPAFWPTYLFVEKVEPDFHVHLHGAVMLLWLLLLISQAGLIRFGHRAVHRQLGKFSYFLAPVIVVSTLLLAHFRMKQGLTQDILYFFYLQLSLLILFVLAYSLAIHYRHTPALHARYMVCTALALVDPIFARLLYNHLGITPPLMQILTFALIDVILLALTIRDWKQGNGLRVFPAMLGAFVLLEIPTFFWPELPSWRGFVQWYAGLPLP